MCLALAIALGMGDSGRDARIENPQQVPVSMDEEGAGPNSPFFPSASNTTTGDLIPSEFFMNSESPTDFLWVKFLLLSWPKTTQLSLDKLISLHYDRPKTNKKIFIKNLMKMN